MPKGKKLGSNCKKDNDCKNNNCVDGQCTHRSKGVSRPRSSSSAVNEVGSAFSATGDFLSNVGQGTTSALTGLTAGVASYMPSFSSSQPEEKDNTYDDYDETESIPESVPEELADMIRDGSITILMINGERYYMNPGNGIIYNEAGDVVGEELENGETTVSPQPETSYDSISPNTAAAATGLAALGSTAYDNYDKVENLSNTVNSILDEEPDSGSGETEIIQTPTPDSDVQKYSDEAENIQTPSPDSIVDSNESPTPIYDDSVSPDTVSPLDYTDNTMPESAKFVSSGMDDTNMLPGPSISELGNTNPTMSMDEYTPDSVEPMSEFNDTMNEYKDNRRNLGGKSRRKYKKATKKRKGRKNKNTRRKKRGSRRR